MTRAFNGVNSLVDWIIWSSIWFLLVQRQLTRFCNCHRCLVPCQNWWWECKWWSPVGLLVWSHRFAWPVVCTPAAWTAPVAAGAGSCSSVPLAAGPRPPQASAILSVGGELSQGTARRRIQPGIPKINHEQTWHLINCVIWCQFVMSQDKMERIQ